MKKISILLSFTLIFCCGCSESEQPQQIGIPAVRDFFAMDTYMNLKVYGENAEKAASECENEIKNLENLLDVTNENSDIWKINHSNGKNTPVSNITLNLINTAIKIGNQTKGALDITIYPVLKEWGFTTGEYKIPSQKTLSQLIKNVDYSRIETFTDNVTIPENFQIDMGALAKGYTSDRLMEIFKKYNISSAIVNLGGNVQTLGKKTDGTLWNVAVVNPFDPQTDICIVSVENKAVITSGNYERFFIGDDEKKYWHIIDSEDGYPADNGLVSVTIIGESGLLCDALSTALFVMGLDDAVEFWKSGKYDFDMILVTDDAKMFITEGIESNCKQTVNIKAEVIKNE